MSRCQCNRFFRMRYNALRNRDDRRPDHFVIFVLKDKFECFILKR
jgi:hypothetical protein